MRPLPSSRLPGFYRLPAEERRSRLVGEGWLSPVEAAALAGAGGFDLATAEAMSENVVGIHALPLSVAANFVLDGREVLIPMAIEEPSVVAAASNAARLVRAGGGFRLRICESEMIAQVHLAGLADARAAASLVEAHGAEVLAAANRACPRLCDRGGGARSVSARVLAPDLLAVHVIVDCLDAMGANLVNTVAEAVAPLLEELVSGQAALRILSNLADRRLVHCSARVPVEDLGVSAAAIALASRIATLDPYRAATHNKGIMNGADAVAIACGQDFRGLEAGAHAYAAREGRYRPLAEWRVEGDELVGELELPVAVGIVGGAQRVHPGVRLALKLMGARSAKDLAAAIAAAGLASNLAALKALAGEGIQRGHMALHARAVAADAGAGALLEQVSERLAAERDYRPERAREVLAEIRGLRLA